MYIHSFIEKNTHMMKLWKLCNILCRTHWSNLLPIAIMKTTTTGYSRREEIIFLIYPDRSPSAKKIVKQRGNLQSGTETEILGEYYILAGFHSFLIRPRPISPEVTLVTEIRVLLCLGFNHDRLGSRELEQLCFTDTASHITWISSHRLRLAGSTSQLQPSLVDRHFQNL